MKSPLLLQRGKTSLQINNCKFYYSIMIEHKVLSVFDFDGTLTRHDSFILFLYFAFGKSYFIKCLIRMIFPIIRYIQQDIVFDDLKKELIRIFLTNANENWICWKAEVFCKKYWKKLMRSSILSKVAEEVNSGSEVTICSASPTLLLRPFANRLGVKFIGTNLEVKNGSLTGYIIGYNCRFAQKVVRLEQIYGSLDNYYLRVWGNDRGDYELLSIAQDPHLISSRNIYARFLSSFMKNKKYFS